MATEPQVLLWPGVESKQALEQALSERRETTLILSAGLHNALVARLASEAPPGQAGLQVEACDAGELLERLRDVAGLEPLAELEPTVRDRNWRVSITSPAPKIVFTPC